MTRRLAAALALCSGAALALPAALTTPASAAPAPTAPAPGGQACPAPAPLSFAEPSYVDTTRAGGEPLVATLASGRLVYSAHAGTTHFFTPEAANPGSAAFVENYTGQTYVWTSDDSGATWQFRPRVGPDNLPLSGFSDPEVATERPMVLARTSGFHFTSLLAIIVFMGFGFSPTLSVLYAMVVAVALSFVRRDSDNPCRRTAACVRWACWI